MGFIWLVIVPVAVVAWGLGWLCKTCTDTDIDGSHYMFMASMSDLHPRFDQEDKNTFFA